MVVEGGFGLVVGGVVLLGRVEVELIPGVVFVGAVLPIGGVVPGVVLGVVPGVVLGVVPGVMLGVVPGVVPGKVVGALGGQIVVATDAVLEEAPGKVEFVLDEGLEVLIPGEVEALELVVEGVVVVTGHVVVGVVEVGRAEGKVELVLGVLWALLAFGAEGDWLPGTTGVGVTAPVDGDWAAAIPTARQSIVAIRIARVFMRVSPGLRILRVGWLANRCSCSEEGKPEFRRGHLGVVAQTSLKIAFDVGPVGISEDFFDPGIALEPDHLKVENARGDAIRRARHVERLVERGGEDVVMKLVLVRPPVYENEIGIDAAVHADETDAIGIRRHSVRGQHQPR